MEGEANEGMINKITKTEVNQALKKIMKNRMLGLDGISIEVWSILSERRVCRLTRLFNKILA